MPNDDLGQFPTPPASTDPILPPAPPVEPEPTTSSPAETFEETPDVLPAEPVYSAPAVPEVPPEPAPATIPTPKGGPAIGSLIVLALLLISGVALAVTVFLFSQTKQLKQQLSEVTQTLEQQRTTITPTPTPTIIDFPAPTPESTVSGTITPTPTATTSATTTALPLANASKALKVAIKHLPNAQMILIKTENATSPTLASTKYFFRQDLTTKKYFYVLISGNQEPEIMDKAIYVTPDNNISSLNDLIQGSTLGIDLDEAVSIANLACTSQLCNTATIKAQYIKSGVSVIWQISLDPVDASKSPLIIQINAQSKEILFRSPGF